MVAMIETFDSELLEAARDMILPVQADPEKGLILFFATAMLMASLSSGAPDPAADIETMIDDIRDNALEFVRVTTEVRFDA